MGFFSWLGNLLDQLVDWLGRAVKAFLEGLMWALQKLWDAVVATALKVAFGFVVTLYIIFYAGVALGETIMEIWDPSYVNSKPSQVFKMKQAPQNSPLPKKRSEAKVLTLENWY
ncbi:hypothetical protein BGP_2639 [Beggiatoa sp. PS]|nr:hypothetical protein BGP_2639 [Beggiatoa sp. PS]